ncbi:MAG: bifunctional demethylmenaquinone methyltransferase/2-methoxy-6-polyprenyl-1,4-benzoquinol methylase UbiE [Candidatus Kapabacteria bacterium]|nr:bifunctional demethylmenaquinone methyltransferase/2-methoxy-6-polyprenyl-1,4-benzoquinol methylase UbiE [Candidatus Kapabacteria bacterium]
MPEKESIQSMFSAIANSYDRANEILSLGLYKKWYKELLKLAAPNDNDSIIDLATGTGNLAILFKKHNNKLKVTGVDFSQNMLTIAKEKCQKENLDINWTLGDATHLDFPNKTFNIATISFGIRNVSSIEDCLKEMARIVKTDGKILILEFGTPIGFIKHFYKFYSNFIIPIIGGIITGNKKAYSYLNQSSLEFPYGEKFIEIIKTTKLFKNFHFKPLFNGIAYLYYAEVL